MDNVLERLEDYIKNKAEQDLTLLKDELRNNMFQVTNQVPRLKGGSTRKRGGATPNGKNGPTNTTRVKNASNKLTQKKPALSLIVLSLLILPALFHYRKLIPNGMTLQQLVLIFGDALYDKVIEPFMGELNKVFKIFTDTTLPNTMKGLYMKAIATLNGTDAVADPNRLFATSGNIVKLSNWILGVFLFIKTKVRGEQEIDDKDAKNVLDDIIKYLNENIKDGTNYNFMKIPAGSVLMTLATS